MMTPLKTFAALAVLSTTLSAQYPLPKAGISVDEVVPLSPAQRTEFEAAMKARNYTRAETLLVKAVEANQKSYALLKLVGGVFLLDKKYFNSALAFKKAELIEPLDEASRFTLAMAFLAGGRSDGARLELEKLAQAHPKTSLYVYWLARLDYDDQKFEAAVKKLHTAIALTPDYMKAHDNLGLCLEALGRYDKAAESYNEAIRLNRLQKTGSAWPPLNMGVMLLKLGKSEEAEGYLREALQYDPGFAEAHYRLGMLLEKKGEVEEAIAELKRAAALDTAYPEPAYALARLYRKTGDMEEAKTALKDFQRRKRGKDKKEGGRRQHAGGQRTGQE